LVANAEKVATTNGKPMVITVVDREGNLKAFSRIDGDALAVGGDIAEQGVHRRCVRLVHGHVIRVHQGR
jgi:uncharacterized protein GlcG (DUF336 family)